MAEMTMFDELFIEYVQMFFFKHPTEAFGLMDITNSFPSFYRDPSMVSGAIHILLMRGMVLPVPLRPDAAGVNIDKWIASKQAIEDLEKSKDIERRTKIVDLKLKELSESNFKVPIQLSKASIIVSGVASTRNHCKSLAYIFKK